MRVLLIGFALALGSRLSDEYWRRQKRLEEDVERARKRLDAAIVRWNSLR